MPGSSYESCVPYVRALQQRELQTDFARLRRIPSSGVYAALDYYGSITPAERAAILDYIAQVGAASLHPDDAPSSIPALDLTAMAASRTSLNWRHQPLRFVRNWVSETLGNSVGLMVPAPQDAIDFVHQTKTVNAPDIRKAMKVSFAARFGAKAVNDGGGCWDYHGTHAGRKFTVSIAYAGNSHGVNLEYHVGFGDPPTRLYSDNINYEALFCPAHGDWDFMTANNLSDSINLLSELVAELIELPDRIREMAM